jgi:hypothetical protein
MTLDIGILGYRFIGNHLFPLGSAELATRAKTWAKKRAKTWAKKTLARRGRARETDEVITV